MAAMIFIGFPQERQREGSKSQTLEMSLAQERLRRRRNSESSWEEVPGAVEGPCGVGGSREGDALGAIGSDADMGRTSGGGAWTGGFRIQPAFLRNVVERAP